MTIPTNDTPVVDYTAAGRFVIREGRTEAELVYFVKDDRLVLVHTEVPEEWGGHGIGGRLVRAALARAAADHLTVAPWCPFARRWPGRPSRRGGRGHGRLGFAPPLSLPQALPLGRRRVSVPMISTRAVPHGARSRLGRECALTCG